MEERVKISELKNSLTLKGDEFFVVNQQNPVDKKLETRATPIGELLSFIKAGIKESLDEIMPVGSLKAYTGKVENIDSVPGWLLCNGSKVSRTKYQKLYNVIGSLYGGVGSETFSLPDLRGRVIMGYCNGTSPLNPKFGYWDENQNITLGSNNLQGEFYHKLNVSELPAHAHNNNHTHQYFNIAHLNYGYIDMYRNGIYTRGSAVIAFAPGDMAAKAIEESKNKNVTTFSPDVSAYIGETSEAGGYTTVAGDNEPHNNMQPYVTVNYLIKY
jgi:microcystin-dependent protein